MSGDSVLFEKAYQEGYEAFLNKQLPFLCPYIHTENSTGVEISAWMGGYSNSFNDFYDGFK